MKVSIMDNPKSRSKAMKIAVGVSGVESAAIGGDNKDQIEVIGEIDSVELTNLLRKRFCRVELLSVGPVEKKKEEKKEDAICYCPPYGYPYPMYAPFQCQYYEEPCKCSIM
ncbi:hypothetical protein QL285_062083 [Trifolium repens]|nr:hypothetical protein QL285_062083 [Trifolium repens]